MARLSLLLLFAWPVMGQPHLLVNTVDLERIRGLSQRQPWAAAVMAGIVRRANAWPETHVREFGLSEFALPQEGAGWSHDYVCPEHGVRLTQKAGKNICPVDGKDYHGWPVDNVVYMQRNDDVARAARDLGLAYRLTSSHDYVEKARRIFNGYAELYPRLPIHDNANQIDTKRGARVMSQTLSEAKWLVPLAFGYDLVRDALTAAERDRFEENVLRNAAAVIARNDAGASNWQSWHNAALLAVGVLTDDDALKKLAVDGPGGFRFQLKEGITVDGPWHEGSWGYHFFALEPLLLTREMAMRAGFSLPEAGALKRMLDAPLACVFPDGTLPGFNDSGPVRLNANARYYEIGYRLFHDQRYMAVLRGQARELEALLWGDDRLPLGERVALASEVLPSAGMATLRVPGSDHTVAVKFGPHGGGHGHFDKLTFVSYANGTKLAVDPGTQAYGAKSHATWDKMTVAHNTIVVDEKTQGAATGKLLDWTPLANATAIRVSAGPVYPGIEMERTMVHTADYTLDISQARATDGKTHRFDWVYHNFGRVSSVLPVRPYAAFPTSDGYRHLTDTSAAETTDGWQAVFTQAGCILRVWMLGGKDTTVAQGAGLGPDLRVPVPFVMARRRGDEARFAALYEPYRSTPVVKRFQESAPGVFSVAADQWTDEIITAPGKYSVIRSKLKPGNQLHKAGSASGRDESKTGRIENGMTLSVGRHR